MKYLAAVLLALLSNGVLASEVGALDPSTSNAPSSFDVAIAEIGASDRWEAPSSFSVVPVELASSHQVENLDEQMAAINAHINDQLNALIEQKVAQSLQF